MRLDAKHVFLAELIDDAGLFPPAKLPMRRALEAHRESKRGRFEWMLGRFICPASRLEELIEAVEDLPDLTLSVVLDGVAQAPIWADGINADLGRVRRFIDRYDARARIECLEVRIPDAHTAAASSFQFERALEAFDLAGRRPEVFMELPLDANWHEGLDQAIDALAQSPYGAKLRCGGLVADAFPSPEQVARFIGGCVRKSLAFKLTAGLHHPIRHVDEASGFHMHGFVNLLGATVLAAAELLSLKQIERVIADEHPHSFMLTEDGFRWRDRTVGLVTIEQARTALFTAYGSCSFSEPVDDLTALGMLP